MFFHQIQPVFRLAVVFLPRVLAVVALVVVLQRQEVLALAVVLVLRAAPVVLRAVLAVPRRVLVDEVFRDVVVVRRRELFQLGIIHFSKRHLRTRFVRLNR